MTHIVGTIDQLSQRCLTRACLPDDGDGLPCIDLEVHMVQNTILTVAKAYILKNDLAFDRRDVAAHVLVEFRLGANDVQNALRTSYPVLYERKGEDR